MHFRAPGALLLCGLMFAQAAAGSVEQDVRGHLDNLRAIKAGVPDSKLIDQYNRQMDAAWKYFIDNKKEAVPVLRRHLDAEIASSRRSELVLLDIGYFLASQGEPADKAIGKRALLALDPSAPIIRQNQRELFEFTHRLAPDRDPEVLSFIDRAFLRESVDVFIPQHSLRLDSTLTCVFLYGIHGEGAEAHLKGLLADPKFSKKVMEILGWIGSPDSNEAVKKALMSSRDYDTLARATAFLMMQGGPGGRAMMLDLKPDAFDAKARDYYGKIRDDVEAVTYEVLKRQLEEIPGDAKLGDAEVKKRLSAMYENYGKDESTSPAAILNSTLPASFLIGELTRIRSRMFYRISDEALSDVKVTNALLNTLRFRP